MALLIITHNRQCAALLVRHLLPLPGFDADLTVDYQHPRGWPTHLHENDLMQQVTIVTKVTQLVQCTVAPLLAMHMDSRL